ncbi:DUF397 domain-containing protein [Goodfellowiella coeruleoviolacea]|uniref:DUF397 domain-containing protein n=1 Tax=Goodfellowiella coeruleoviolacea TaxID=334858 RepID=A0AAE3GM57_9PSEU|nr:DUF397 domain-containing protein [Goodfellowiella coeruleoviolacea]MCP2169949.1 protein of unknown function (DUF397) [Goodfellowiella coeruleoviolacea]
MSAPDLPVPRWVKSSYSTNNGNCVEVAYVAAGADWRKSSYSTNNGTCVELATGTEAMFVRDSKNPDGPVLTFSSPAFAAFLSAIRSTDLDLG